VQSAAHDPTTILFTDIEGSSRLWEQHGQKMSRVLAEHDALARTTVAENGGVVVKMVGDGLYAVFDDALGAVQATLTLQRSLASIGATHDLPLRVRCGVHAGVVERRDNDLFGSAVNRAARIMGAAHGGQVLLSQAVVDRVQDRLPDLVSLRDLGGVRLRDLSTPERIYQLVHPELRDTFPALRSLEVTPNNLPQQTTTFIGRERELAEAKELLAGTRLLTLLGMGGMGKTRLSLQIASDVMDAFPEGAWFADLAPVKDRTVVVNEVAQIFGVPEEPGRPLLQTLCSHLRAQKLLLVLDNCEHLVSACATLANALLRAAPEVKIIATTREALRVPGEQTYPVMPLALPDRKAGVDVLARSEAVQLFVERVRLQKPGFVLTDRDAQGVADLCARVEGIPLALELAAARMSTLSIDDINRRLNDRYKLLSGGSRVLLERQQTLRALVGWSYDLLQENERVFLDRLSVFAGGFDLAAAEKICSADPLDEDDVIDLLASLVEKSLVMVEQRDAETRYRLLETICDYARERLIKRDDVAATAARHCSYYLSFAQTARAKLSGPEQAEWTRRLEAELDNLRAAIALSLSGGTDGATAVKLQVALMRFWTLRGYSSEGRNNIRAALELPEVREPGVPRAHALYVGGVLAMNQSGYAEARTLLTECLAIRRELGNPREIAATLSTLSIVHLEQDTPAAAKEYAVQALEIFRELGDQVGESIGLVHLGEICVQEGDPAQARQHYEASMTLARAVGHQEVESDCQCKLGELALDEGNLQDARERFSRSLRVCRVAEDKRGEATALAWLGRTDAAAGDIELARRRLNEAQRAFQAFDMHAEALDCLEDYAQLLQVSGESAVAVRLFAAASDSREALALPRAARREARWRASLEGARAAVGATAFDAAWNESRAWTLDEAVDYALESTTAVAAAD
jgi:predicted ATPase/class 3 adenylate cyclase